MICSPPVLVSMVTSVTWQNDKPLVKYAIQGSKNKWETSVALGLCKTILMPLSWENISPFTCFRSRKTRHGVMVICQEDFCQDWSASGCLLGGCMDCWLSKGNAANPGHSIVRCRGSGPWNLFFFSVYVFFSHGVGTKDLAATGSWELELISPMAGTQRCIKPSPDVTGDNNAVSLSTLVRGLFSLGFDLHSEYKWSLCWGWSETSY